MRFICSSQYRNTTDCVAASLCSHCRCGLAPVPPTVASLALPASVTQKQEYKDVLFVKMTGQL